MIQVVYRDSQTGESITIDMEAYQLNNENLLPEEEREKYRNFCEGTGRIIEREVYKKD